MTLTLRVSGEYCMELRRAGVLHASTGWMKNIITDTGLDALGNDVGGFHTFCRVGTGTTTPATGQNALTAQIASTNIRSTSSDVAGGSPNYVRTVTFAYTFAHGAVVGNIAEIGVGRTASGANLCSRSRILDSGGTPTTLTVTAIDQLTAYYRFSVTPVLTDSAGSVTLDGIAYPYTARIAAVGSAYSNLSNVLANGRLGFLFSAQTYTGAIGAITGTPSGLSGAATTSITQAAYTPGSYYLDNTILFGVGQGNAAGGIKSLEVVGSSSNSSTDRQHQYEFATVIPKTNTKTLSLTFRVAWARA